MIVWLAVQYHPSHPDTTANFTLLTVPSSVFRLRLATSWRCCATQKSKTYNSFLATLAFCATLAKRLLKGHLWNPVRHTSPPCPASSETSGIVRCLEAKQKINSKNKNHSSNKAESVTKGCFYYPIYIIRLKSFFSLSSRFSPYPARTILSKCFIISNHKPRQTSVTRMRSFVQFPSKTNEPRLKLI